MAAYPGVNCSESGNIEELLKWQRMHESVFFNPGRRVTETDVRLSLEFSRGGDRTRRKVIRPNGGPRTPAVAKTTGLKNSVTLYTKATGTSINTHVGPVPPRTETASPEEDEENRPPTPQSRPVTRTSICLTTPQPDYSRASSRLSTPRPSRPLQRRPRTPGLTPEPPPANNTSTPRTTPPPKSPKSRRVSVLHRQPQQPEPPANLQPPVRIQIPAIAPVERVKSSIPAEKVSSSHLSAVSSTGTVQRLDDWIRCSFTTVCRDDPTDPQSYYNTHYPLVLQKIPRRRKSADSLHNLSNLAANQPEIDMSFYDTVPLRRLSTPVISETTLGQLVRSSTSMCTEDK